MTILPSGVRHAVRRWRHRPGVAVTAVLVLSLGIGTTTAMYSIVDALLLKAEPWPEAERLVRIYGVQPQLRTNPSYEKTWNRGAISWQSWRDLQKVQAFADVAVWVPAEQIVGGDRTEFVRAFFASSSLPLLVGAQPLHGRFFNAQEDEADSGTVILSHKLWMRLFGGDPNVIGTVTSLTLPGGSLTSRDRRTIVGVLPEHFAFPGETPDVLIPIGFHKYNGSYGNAFFQAIGRLNPDATVTAAAAAAEPLVRRDDTPDRRTSRVVTLRTDRIGLGNQPLWLMLAAAGLLLVVACANVAGLLLSDARSRHHETAVRLSLGGTRAAILRSLLGEHLVLAIAAAGGGVLVATWMIPSLVALAPPGLAGDQPIGLDNRIAGWSIAAAVLTTLLAGLIPSAAISAAKPGDALKLGARAATRGGRWRHRLVVASQFTVALVLLVGAGLFAETLLRLGREPLGFNPDGVAVVGVAPARRAQSLTKAESDALIERGKTHPGGVIGLVMERQWVPMLGVLDRVKGLAGVEAAAFADVVPFTAGVPRSLRYRAEGRPVAEAQPVFTYSVSNSYFAVLGIELHRGQLFDRDVERTGRGRRLPASGPLPRQSVVVSQTLERRLLDGNGVGRTLMVDKFPYDVIGVVADVKHRGVLDDDTAAVYTLASAPDSMRYVVSRVSGSAETQFPGLRTAIEQPGSPVFASSIARLSDLVDATLVVERSRALLSSAYGLAALLLASVGLYGLAARLVAERRREIGIRVALGAGRGDVRRLVMADAWMIVAIGLVVGLPSAFVAARLTQNMLFGIAPAAPHVLGIAGLALTIAAVTATLVPAWRANRIDPAVTLRDE